VTVRSFWQRLVRRRPDNSSNTKGPRLRFPEITGDQVDVVAEILAEEENSRALPAESDPRAHWRKRVLRHMAGEAAKEPEQLPRHSATKRLMEGDLVSENELRAAVMAAQGLVGQDAASAIALRGRARRLGHVEDGGDEGHSGALLAEDAQLVADIAADAINHTLARLFMRLGPPPEGASGDYMPVSSGGGGAQQ
jgi:hypothetical protein